MIFIALNQLAMNVWSVVKSIPLWWLCACFSVKSVCTSMTRFHPLIRKSRTHLVKSPHSLLEYLLKNKINFQPVRWGCLPFLHKSLIIIGYDIQVLMQLSLLCFQVSRNRMVIGVRAFVLDWSQAWSGRMPLIIKDAALEQYRSPGMIAIASFQITNKSCDTSSIWCTLTVDQWRFMTNCWATPVWGGLRGDSWALTYLHKWRCFDCMLPWQ